LKAKEDITSHVKELKMIN